MSIYLLFTISVVFSVARFSSCFSADQQYEKCLSPPTCGSAVFPNTTYPFWGNEIGKPSFCGHKEFELSCEDNKTLTLEIENLTLRVVSANLSYKSITVADENLFHGGCPQIFNFTGTNQFPRNYQTDTIDLFECTTHHQTRNSLSRIICLESDNSWKTFHVFISLNPYPDCSKVGEIPMLESAKNDLRRSKNDSDGALMIALGKGFELRYDIEDQNCRDCSISTGICGSESGSGNFRCLCQDKPHNSSCSINDDQAYAPIDQVYDNNNPG